MSIFQNVFYQMIHDNNKWCFSRHSSRQIEKQKAGLNDVKRKSTTQKQATQTRNQEQKLKVQTRMIQRNQAADAGETWRAHQVNRLNTQRREDSWETGGAHGAKHKDRKCTIRINLQNKTGNSESKNQKPWQKADYSIIKVTSLELRPLKQHYVTLITFK